MGSYAPTLTLHLSGAVGFLSDDGFADDLETLVEWCAGDVVIDCAEVTFIDSIGIDALVDTQRRLNSQGRLLRVVGLSGTPRRVIVSLGLTEFLLLEGGDAPPVPGTRPRSVVRSGTGPVVAESTRHAAHI